MRLGEMLVRDGRVGSEQLETAAAHQKRAGGRFGTVLVELGFVDADSIAVYLGLELGIPIATRAIMDRAKRAAVRLLTPAQAERLLCVPLVVQDRDLIVAMRDPHDLEVLDKLATITGYRVIPSVAPDIFLYYYVERYYGVPRPARFRAMDDIVFHRRKTAEALEPPPPPLPGLPPPVENPVAPPTSLTALTSQAPKGPAAEKERKELEQAEAFARELEMDKGATAEKAPTLPVPTGQDRFRAVAAADTTQPVVDSAPPQALDLDNAVARMAKAESRGEVADALVGYARASFDVGVVLIVKENVAIGWRGFGPELNQDRLETLLIPLDAASIFQSAIEANELFVGAAPPSALHAQLFKILRTQPPRHAVVLPIVIRERVVNLLYAQKNVEAELSATEQASLRKLAEAARDAYVRLIARQKKR